MTRRWLYEVECMGNSFARDGEIETKWRRLKLFAKRDGANRYANHFAKTDKEGRIVRVVKREATGQIVSYGNSRIWRRRW